MKYKIGDKVKFLDDVGGGIITEIIDANTVNVNTGDDWEVPTAISNLIKIEDKVIDKVEIPVVDIIQSEEINKVENSRNEEDYFCTEIDRKADTVKNNNMVICLAFVPENQILPTESNIDVYLVNDSDYDIFYNIAAPDGNLVNSNSGVLEANAKVIVDEFTKDELRNVNNYGIQIIFYKSTAYKSRSPFERDLKIKPARFFKLKSYIENDFFNEKAIITNIIDENLMAKEIEKLSGSFVDSIIKDKEIKSEKLNKPPQFHKNINPAFITEEVDLHIYELVDDESSMSSQEILDYQLKVIKQEMDSAIKRRIKSIVFIHGVGNGRLKLELRGKLNREYKKYRVQDASFKEYGYGATMVLIR